MKNKYNLILFTCAGILLSSCSGGSAGGTASNGGTPSQPSGTYGQIKFTPTNLNMNVGTAESLTITLTDSSLSPELTIPLSTTTDGIVIIPNECKLGGVPPGPWGTCTFTVQALGVGTTKIIAGWKDWPATGELTVTVN